MDGKRYPFGIEFVIGLDMPEKRKYRSVRSSQADYDCPFCNKQRKFHADLQKGVFRCNACNENGGITKLHMRLCNFPDTRTAAADLYRKWTRLTEDERKAVIERKEAVSTAPDISSATTISVRDKVYRSLLSLLSLSDDHRKDLLKRGLSEDEIEKRLYRTVPAIGFETFAEKSLAMSGTFNQKSAEDSLNLWRQIFMQKGSVIPGYYSYDNKIRLVKRKSGYYVPVIDRNGLISGLQIRYDNLSENASEKQRESYHKYCWFSSSEKDTGCSVTGIQQIHYTGFPEGEKIPKEVYLTEGALKADIASYLSGEPFIALIGVNNVSQLALNLQCLKEHGTSRINVCVDMDYREKSEVQNALNTILDIIQKSGLACTVLTWDESFKGIDDFLLAKKKYCQ